MYVCTLHDLNARGANFQSSLFSAGITYTDEMDAQIRKPVEAGFEKEGHPYYASARLWDDG